MCFLDLQISKKKNIPKYYPELDIKFPTNYSILLLAGNLNLVFGIFLFEIWRSKKHIALSEKKPLGCGGIISRRILIYLSMKVSKQTKENEQESISKKHFNQL